MCLSMGFGLNQSIHYLIINSKWLISSRQMKFPILQSETA